MKKYELEEARAQRGAGGGIYCLDSADNLYAALIPTVKLPFITTTMSDIEIKVVNSAVISKIDGVKSLNASETEVYMHRDIINKLESLKGQTLNLMSVAPDFTAFKYAATVSYTPNEAETDNAWTGTMKITPLNEPVYIENCFKMLKPTLKFTDAIPPIVELVTTTGNTTVLANTDQAETSITATPDDAATATAQVTKNSVKITGVKAGATIVRIKATKSGFATAETTVLVIVPAA